MIQVEFLGAYTCMTAEHTGEPSGQHDRAQKLSMFKKSAEVLIPISQLGPCSYVQEVCVAEHKVYIVVPADAGIDICRLNTCYLCAS